MDLKRFGEYYLNPLFCTHHSAPSLWLSSRHSVGCGSGVVNLILFGDLQLSPGSASKAKYSYCLSWYFFHISCLSPQVPSQEGRREEALAFYFFGPCSLPNTFFFCLSSGRFMTHFWSVIDPTQFLSHVAKWTWGNKIYSGTRGQWQIKNES